MKLAVMQPYLLPYIGYFQLVGAVDRFVVYDNIKYTKKGWINRNRMLVNGTDRTFTLPLKADSDLLDVCQRRIADDFDPQPLLERFRAAYRRAPHFAAGFALLEEVLRCPERNLFAFLHHALLRTCARLGLATEILVSSAVPIDHGLRAQDKVLAFCDALGATEYLNAIGGLELYDREAFRARGVELRFLRALPFEYPQLGQPFVPWLSILDVLMFNPAETVRERLRTGYELV